jgi:divalent metal cation (Fe/Co/Zn/Cd) transporter
MPNKIRNDQISAVVLFILAIVIFVSAINIPVSDLARLQKGPGASAFPIFVAVLLFILSIALFFSAGQKGKDLEKAPKEASKLQAENVKIELPVKVRLAKILGSIVMLVTYILILPYVGFIASTTLFGLAFLTLIFKVTLKKSILPAIIISMFCYIAFELGLKIPLPSFMQSIR